MSELVERQFPASSLLNGIRSIGYSFSTAVADIIDNSISAEATDIHIFSDPLVEVPYFCILDNGYGMDAKSLDNAMLPGSNRKSVVNSEKELGRFGLGLKSASLSQCREFTVASKKFGKIRAMSFDLDVIEETDKLMLKQLSNEEIDILPNIERLRNYETGTLVIWTKFDKIEELAKDFETSFRNVVSDSKKHVELVFHRYYEEINIYYNMKRIERRDPFLLGSQGRQQTGRTSTINVDDSIITVIPYTLPFAKTITAEEKALLGNPKSIYDDQGFYLYRNKRLISWGNWMRMGIRSELNKLARVQVDIPSSLDSVWALDVKKSSAKIPDKIKDQIKIAVEDSIVRSKRTVRNPGVKEAAPVHTVWERINEHDGKSRYEINRDNPLIRGFVDKLDDETAEIFDLIIKQLESSIPKYRIHNDVIDSIDIQNTIETDDEELLFHEIIKILQLVSKENRESKLNYLLNSEFYTKLAGRKAEILEVALNE